MLPRSARGVQAALLAAGIDAEVRELPDSTRTAPEAAAAVGCALGAIVKSLVFRAGDRAVVALVSGDRRADERRLGELAGAPLARADADFVRAATGYAIGGVPPLGHSAPLTTAMDEGLWRFQEIWAAAGTPRCVFPVAPDELAAALGVEPAAFAREG
jgi:prolyl-tRNA editing enzyme YbaK/EbsC (Cys-tRNA(Pro) deacylase)